MIIKSITELEGKLEDKTVIVRVDFNIPVIEGKISDYTRIMSSLQSINYLQEQGAKIVLITHFGRPEGKTDPALSLAFLVPELTKILKRDVKFSYQHTGHEPKQIIESMKVGDILLLENIRFNKNEELNNKKFALDLAALGDFYINEAFSCSHRPHASIIGITAHLPSYAGFLFLNEVKNLTLILDDVKKQSLAIIGGKKVSTKLHILANLSQKMNKLAIVGAMANTFLKAKGYQVWKSFYENELLKEAKNILEKSKAEIILPDDFICISNKDTINWKLKNLSNIQQDDKIFDIGPNSAFLICQAIYNSEVVVWNGPLGVFEDKRFAFATDTIARFIGARTQAGAIKSIAGGGDTVSAINNSHSAEYFSYISTAGGAFIELLEGKNLPGLCLLIDES
ncbi:MAG: phosphoglycerate kinase [Candidatus Midichloria sp.]|nr:MAG: phosphoglycerate kinase [Candidatus Midichloria sp.]